MPPPAVVTLFDVDNTLLDDDRIVADMRRHLVRTVGDEQQRRYWELFEQLREELGYADYLGALQRFRMEDPHRPHLIQVSTFLLNYPFANRLFPASLDAVEHAASWGEVAIVSVTERRGLVEGRGPNRPVEGYSKPGETRPSNMRNGRFVTLVAGRGLGVRRGGRHRWQFTVSNAEHMTDGPERRRHERRP
jgi:hypothetical protein